MSFGDLLMSSSLPFSIIMKFEARSFYKGFIKVADNASIMCTLNYAFKTFCEELDSSGMLMARFKVM